MAVKNYMR